MVVQNTREVDNMMTAGIWKLRGIMREPEKGKCRHVWGRSTLNIQTYLQLKCWKTKKGPEEFVWCKRLGVDAVQRKRKWHTEQT
jgi:hypothetical protein